MGRRRNVTESMGFLMTVAAMALYTVMLIASTEAAADAPGTITFKARNMMGTANGVFHKFSIVESQVRLNAIEAGHVVVRIDVASLDTDNERRDDHLRTVDFFEADRWPLAHVRVYGAELVEDGRYKAKFDVDIRDITKTIEGDFEIVTREPLVVRGSVTIDRMDFEVGTPKTWNPMSITQEIPITFEVTLPH